MTNISPNTIKHQQNEKAYITDYWQKRTPEFSKLRKQELHSDKYAKWQQEILTHLPQNKPLKILDIGCGAGFFSILLAKCGHNVTGIDLTAPMITAAEQLAQEEQARTEFEVMDAENLRFADSSFDVIIARNLMWNLPNPAKAYIEWLRVLKTGGTLLNYDAEYAKDHHEQKLPKLNAHANVSSDLLEQCHNIYHMLDISAYNRPAWDLQILRQLGGNVCTVDTEVGSRIYSEEDIFYIPVPMFCVKVIKE